MGELSAKHKVSPENVLGHGEMQGGAGGNKEADEGTRSAREFREAAKAGEITPGGGRRAKLEVKRADGSSEVVDLDMGKSEGYFIRTMIHNLDKIEAKSAKIGLQDASAAMVKSWVEGKSYQSPDGTYRIFNPADDGHRKIVDKAFERAELADKLYAGDPAAVHQAVLVSQQLNYVPDRVGDALFGMVNQKDDSVKRQDGLLAAASIMDRQPFAFDQTKGAAKLKEQAQDFVGMIRGQGLSTQEALKRLDEFNSPEWQKLKGERGKQEGALKAALTESNLTAELDRNGWWPGGQPTLQALGNQNVHVMADFRQAFSEHYLRTGDEKLAKTLAAGEIGRQWGVSNATGTEVLTKNPPERRVPPVGGDHKWVQDDLLGTVNEWRAFQKKPAVTASELAASLAVVSDAVTDREVKDPRRGGAPPSYTLIWKDAESPVGQVVTTGGDNGILNRWRPDVNAARERLRENAGKLRGGELDRLKRQEENRGIEQWNPQLKSP